MGQPIANVAVPAIPAQPQILVIKSYFNCVVVVVLILKLNLLGYPTYLSNWPIKLQHKLFSPQKMHVRMHEKLSVQN